MSNENWKEYWGKDSERITHYDARHGIYNLDRPHIMELIGEYAVIPKEGRREIIDIGAGQGAAAFSVQRKYPDCPAVLIDGSEPMLREAEARAAELKFSVKTILFDFYMKGWETTCGLGKDYPVIVSSMMIHHIDDERKAMLFRDIRNLLAPGGVFVYADMIRHSDPVSDGKAMDLWAAEALRRKILAGMEHGTLEEERKHLDVMFLEQGDKPATPEFTVGAFKKAGFREYLQVWGNIKFGVYVGVR